MWVRMATERPAGHDVPIRLDHVGIAVPEVTDAETVLLALGCEKVHQEESPTGAFVWATYELGDASRLELVAPRDDDSFLAEYLDRNGAGLHHVTLEVGAIDPVVESLDAADVRVVDYREYEGWTEAFVSPRNPTGALFQLMEYHEGYATGRGGPERAYVDGERLDEKRMDARPSEERTDE